MELLNRDLEDAAAAKVKAATPEFDASEINFDELKVLQVLQQTKEEQINNPSWKSQVPVSLLASVLLNLEFRGIVRAFPGKRFRLLT